MALGVGRCTHCSVWESTPVSRCGTCRHRRAWPSVRSRSTRDRTPAVGWWRCRPSPAQPHTPALCGMPPPPSPASSASGFPSPQPPPPQPPPPPPPKPPPPLQARTRQRRRRRRWLWKWSTRKGQPRHSNKTTPTPTPTPAPATWAVTRSRPRRRRCCSWRACAGSPRRCRPRGGAWCRCGTSAPDACSTRWRGTRRPSGG
mmetsp:Transcript_27990/g.90367  ORF Transcript_27990/g.90367 Transcript_27990/m.90367 type:complete len:201 (+) Transcript_27990:530-1132(+)